MWGFNPSLSMFVNLLNSSNHLNYTMNFLPKWLLYLLIATLARSHQNDFPSWEQLGVSFVKNLNSLLISHVGIFKILFLSLEFLQDQVLMFLQELKKRGKAFHVLLISCVMSLQALSLAVSQVVFQKSISYTVYLSHRGNCFQLV